jgi:hypothetical protein
VWMGGGIRLINNLLEGVVQHRFSGMEVMIHMIRGGPCLKTQLRKVSGFVVFSHCDVLATRLFSFLGCLTVISTSL